MSCTPNLVAFVLVGGNVDLESQAEGKKEVEADDVMRSGPRPILGQKDPLEEKMTTHSSILAWEIPWTKPAELQSTGSQRIGHN